MSYRDMDVYRKSFRLALEMHHFSLLLPQYLRYDLSDQLRRASRSVPSNIAEGAARQGTKDAIQFFVIARASLSELDTQLEIVSRLHFINKDNVEKIQTYFI